jgi:hypothetical protein
VVDVEMKIQLAHHFDDCMNSATYCMLCALALVPFTFLLRCATVIWSQSDKCNIALVFSVR